MGWSVAVISCMLVIGVCFVGRSQQAAHHYQSCSMGKGQATLLNCGSKYDLGGTGSVKISDFDSPSR
jgi:hypothetical protein